MSKTRLVLFGGLCLLAQNLLAAGKASHVVLMVWDGMRPDFISPETTPNLWKLTQDGVYFEHHHPVYVSSTEVNGTALATGVYPNQSTIIANNEFRPAIDPLQSVGMQDLETIRKGDEVEDGRYLAFPTVAEILRDNGLRADITGSKPVALLHDRAQRADASLGVCVFAGEALPPQLAVSLAAELGTFPPAGVTKAKDDQWTTSALTGPLWKDSVPPYSLLWMAEPDYSQHKYAPGSPNALIAIKNDDDCLGRVIAALKQKNELNSTDIIVVSDHGFSTVTRHVDLAKTLNEQGFHALRKFPAEGPAQGDILAVGDGGIVLFYVPDHDAHLIERAIHFLQTKSFTGVVLSKTPVTGTFSLDDLHLDSPYAPDFAVALRWATGANQYGAPGLIACDGSQNKGSHATLCPTEMHNVGVAAGPDFMPGLRDPLPSGNIDIAPTILWILGLQPKRAMSGRVLSEALTIPGPAVGKPETHHQEATWRGDGIVWRQYLNTSSVNGVTYYDEGNGAQSEPAKETSAVPKQDQ